MQQAMQERVLQATVNLTAAPGQAPVGMGTIAKAAGVSRQSLYNHFVSRARLMDAAASFVARDVDLPDLNCAPGAQLQRVVAWRASCFAQGLAKIQAMADAGERPDPSFEKALCRNVMTSLYRQNSLSRDWFISSGADMMFVLLSFETWRALSTDAKWSRGAYQRRVERVMQATFLQAG